MTGIAFILSRQRQKQVMEVVKGRVKYRTVKTGSRDREYVEILSGLTPGSVIVKDGSLNLRDNARVTSSTTKTPRRP
ncbi:hypothetical protein SAMN02745133_01903 [Desulforamulus putei DSM 12395]|uniref:CzcB-like C-terminal circularly permuted SH3-like domain-containing protein n=2 Tax=Desulforamulus putei TaxID=74701 RepID=A0A1M4Z5Y1_9FIRM|nr:hypothetical protein SAMN02745133_01903 [Desulforamulus putei DSM 12395]